MANGFLCSIIVNAFAKGWEIPCLNTACIAKVLTNDNVAYAKNFWCHLLHLLFLSTLRFCLTKKKLKT